MKTKPMERARHRAKIRDWLRRTKAIVSFTIGLSPDAFSLTVKDLR